MYLDSGDFGKQSANTIKKENLAALKRLFRKKYSEIETGIKKQLSKYAQKSPNDSYVGITKYLRNHYIDYEIENLTVR